MKSVAKSILIIMLFARVAIAYAEPADDACAALMSARIHLVALMGSTDKMTLDKNNNQLHAASVKLDAVLADMTQGQNTRDAAKAREFQAVWEVFKNTRETEIIPAVYAGKNEVARAIALGIQAERMKKMKAIMGCK